MLKNFPKMKFREIKEKKPMKNRLMTSSSWQQRLFLTSVPLTRRQANSYP